MCYKVRTHSHTKVLDHVIKLCARGVFEVPSGSKWFQVFRVGSPTVSLWDVGSVSQPRYTSVQPLLLLSGRSQQECSVLPVAFAKLGQTLRQKGPTGKTNNGHHFGMCSNVTKKNFAAHGFNMIQHARTRSRN